jgi:peptidoglycan hydrolase-like protein with peptidoglycan-binding domain
LHRIKKIRLAAIVSLAMLLNFVTPILAGQISPTSAAPMAALPQFGSGQEIYSSFESVRSAQMALRDRGYYNGPINGQMTAATRDAIRRFQRDQNLAVTGDINLATARALGLVGDGGAQTVAVDIVNAQAQRVDRDSIRVFGIARTNTGGWRVVINHFSSGNILHVYVRGVPPRFPSSQAVTELRFDETFRNLGRVDRVVIHGAERDIEVDLQTGGGGPGSGTNTGNTRQILLYATRLLQDYQRDLGIRVGRGQTIFDTRRNLRQNEVELLSQLSCLRAAADVYNDLVNAKINDLEALRGGADALLRQVRLTNRLMKRSNLNLSSVFMNDWESFRSELRTINITDIDLERDIDR